ncbi:ANTAR domain-containing protein [Streptomyces sp. NPDC054834]
MPLRCRGTRLWALNVFALADAPAPDGTAELSQAKGMLAERWAIGADEAFTVLRQYALGRWLPLDGVVRAVLERSAEHPELRPPGGEAVGGKG